MNVPTIGDEYSQLMENLRHAQEHAAMIAHLHNADGTGKGMVLGRAWLHVSENFKQLQFRLTELAKGRLQ